MAGRGVVTGDRMAGPPGPGWVPFHRLRKPQLVTLAIALEGQRDRALAEVDRLTGELAEAERKYVQRGELLDAAVAMEAAAQAELEELHRRPLVQHHTHIHSTPEQLLPSCPPASDDSLRSRIDRAQRAQRLGPR